jgi:hypothetical protein
MCRREAELGGQVGEGLAIVAAAEDEPDREHALTALAREVMPGRVHDAAARARARRAADPVGG